MAGSNRNNPDLVLQNMVKLILKQVIAGSNKRNHVGYYITWWNYQKHGEIELELAQHDEILTLPINTLCKLAQHGEIKSEKFHSRIKQE